MRLLPLLLLGALLAPAQTPANKPATSAGTAKPVQDKAAMEAYLRHLFVWGPEIKVEIGTSTPSNRLPGFDEVVITASDAQGRSSKNTYFSTKDGTRLFQANVFDLREDPFAQDQKLLKTEFQPSFGTPGAPVVIVIFSDFQCRFCRDEAKMIRENLTAAYPKEVRVYFKDFPLEQIHPWAKAASIAGRCVFRQNPQAFWDYHDYIFENQASITPENLKDKVVEFGTKKGLEMLGLNRCIDNKVTAAEVEKNQAEGRALNVDSTPTMFINGRRIPGQIDWPTLRRVVDHEVGYTRATGKGGEQACCETKLPSVFPK